MSESFTIDESIWPIVKERDELRAEIEALKEKIKAMKENIGKINDSYGSFSGWIRKEDAQAEIEALKKDAERWRAVITGAVEGIAVCKEGAYGTPWVAIGPNEATQIVDAAMGDTNGA